MIRRLPQTQRLGRPQSDPLLAREDDEHYGIHTPLSPAVDVLQLPINSKHHRRSNASKGMLILGTILLSTAGMMQTISMANRITMAKTATRTQQAAAARVVIPPIAVPTNGIDNVEARTQSILEAALQADDESNNNSIQLERERQQAIEAYRSRIRQLSLLRKQTCQTAAVPSDTNDTRTKTVEHLLETVAKACLSQTNATTAPSLQYPEADAEDHFDEIRLAMSPWAQHEAHILHLGPNNYPGPWIENHWISHFESLFDHAVEEHLNDNDGDTTCVKLSDYFGPFIPLFIPWVDGWVNHGYKYPDGLVDTLLSVLRPNVPYLTISQNDDGLEGNNELSMLLQLHNVLVLSAGGYGHVPIPLLMQPLDPLSSGDDNSLSSSEQEQQMQRPIGLSYVGSLANAPHELRQKMHLQLSIWNATKPTPDSSFANAVSSDASASFGGYHYYYGDQWTTIVQQSKFNLVPRGYGRTSYHLIEILQMGRIPIYLYSDVPWVPYAKLFAGSTTTNDTIGYTTTVSGLRSLVQDTLQHMPLQDILEQEQRIAALRESHFMPAGIMKQIQSFVLGQPGGDLQCQPLPPSRRDNDE